MLYYAGIGSRNTPTEVCELMKEIGKLLGKRRITLRSGHAEGADMSFETGCDSVCGLKEVYLPWDNFNSSTSNLVVKDPEAFTIAEKYHTHWHNLKGPARKLQARNSHQILGHDLKSPVDFVLCWTLKGKEAGGTAQAIRIAKDYNIPILNLGIYEKTQEMRDALAEFCINTLKIGF